MGYTMGSIQELKRLCYHFELSHLITWVFCLMCKFSKRRSEAGGARCTHG